MWEKVKLSTKVFSLALGKEQKIQNGYDTQLDTLDSLCPSQIASFLLKTSFSIATYHLKLTRRLEGLLNSKPKVSITRLAGCSVTIVSSRVTSGHAVLGG